MVFLMLYFTDSFFFLKLRYVLQSCYSFNGSISFSVRHKIVPLKISDIRSYVCEIGYYYILCIPLILHSKCILKGVTTGSGS